MTGCNNLQDNINSVVKWWKLSILSLNIAKSEMVTTYVHSNNNSKEIEDLGVLFDERFPFVRNLQHITLSANKLLGYIWRNAKDFSDVSVMKILYASFVPTKLEYAVLIWYPIYGVLIVIIVKVHNTSY